MTERLILKMLTVVGFLLLPFMYKRPVKDWVLVFFLKAFYSLFLDSIVVSKKRINYPIRLLPNYFKAHILFDCLLFPMICVLYNQITYRSTLVGIFFKVFLFSVPMTLLEHFAERYTKLIKYRKWKDAYTFISVSLTFWLVRATIGLVRQLEGMSDKKTNENE
ncbi:CBO0543 family protein [Halalkalibacter alkalisediminis]|uniref:CBO0543 family protein n=1 Tax=Halalkalibacter alkalisediminis TaxID=935616 RepID=A0ABV6NQV1_9BACI|nr:CBO0543 family protein [Halalkalibacter alkalisediminis]